jgi:hypothetical protein
LRQTQSARAIEGAGASPGREFADAVAGDHGARRPGRAQRGPCSQGLRAAQDLPAETPGLSIRPRQPVRLYPDSSFIKLRQEHPGAKTQSPKQSEGGFSGPLSHLVTNCRLP